MTEPTIREPDQIRRDCARKLRSVQVSDHFQAILGCLLGEDWTRGNRIKTPAELFGRAVDFVKGVANDTPDNLSPTGGNGCLPLRSWTFLHPTLRLLPTPASHAVSAIT